MTRSSSGVPNANNPAVQSIYQAGGTPFSPQFLPFNAPNLAHCKHCQRAAMHGQAVSA